VIIAVLWAAAPGSHRPLVVGCARCCLWAGTVQAWRLCSRGGLHESKVRHRSARMLATENFCRLELKYRTLYKRESSDYVLSNFHLGTSLGPLFCIFEQLGSNQLADVCFSTIGTNLSRHAFHYHCQATALKSNCRCAWLRGSFFADNAFHEILFLQSGPILKDRARRL
jgi:hypothetical protein